MYLQWEMAVFAVTVCAVYFCAHWRRCRCCCVRSLCRSPGSLWIWSASWHSDTTTPTTATRITHTLVSLVRSLHTHTHTHIHTLTLTRPILILILLLLLLLLLLVVVVVVVLITLTVRVTRRRRLTPSLTTPTWKVVISSASVALATALALVHYWLLCLFIVLLFYHCFICDDFVAYLISWIWFQIHRQFQIHWKSIQFVNLKQNFRFTDAGCHITSSLLFVYSRSCCCETESRFVNWTPQYCM